jgi:phosphohistidine phosphatase
MTRLYLLRHGIAEPHGTPGVAEADRPLTSKGEERLVQIARGLQRLTIEPDRIVTSPLVRARRTAEIVAEVLGFDDRLEIAEILSPGYDAEEIREWLREREESSLMMVGHNPNLTELLGVLIGVAGQVLPFDLKKGGVASLRSGESDFHELKWLATPKLLRGLMG